MYFEKVIYFETNGHFEGMALWWTANTTIDILKVIK